MPLIQEQLDMGNTVSFSPRGVSMLPMLRQGKDTVELSSPPERLGKFDLPLYRYPSGKYVMHRIVEVREDCCVCRGDNTYENEYIKPEQMIAVVSAFKRGGRRIEVTAPAYRLYARVWVGSYPVRKFLKRAKGWLRRQIGRLIK